MTQPMHNRPGQVPGASARGWPQWGPWAALGLCVVALVLLASIGPGRLLAALTGLISPKPQGPLSLTVLHSNDTWGYLLPCG